MRRGMENTLRIDFKDEVATIRTRTLSYAADPEFHARWFGVNERSMNLRAQQLRAFSRLLGSVANTLGGWRILDVGCGAGFWLRTLVEMDARPEDLVGNRHQRCGFELARGKNPLIKLLKTDGATIPFDSWPL